nr:hypothetical protein [Tanacetum cinerariifolium]
AQLHHASAERAEQIGRLCGVMDLGEAPTNFVEHAVGGLQVGVGHDHCELFAAVTTDVVGLAQALFQEQRQAFDHPVTHGVAVAVIDLLEVVDVQHRKAQRFVLAACAETTILKQLQNVRVVI